MTRLILSALVLTTFVACDKKAKPVAPTATPDQDKTPVKKKAVAPKGVPQTLTDMVTAEWPKIEELGNTFVAEFEKATKAKAANDRDAMDTSVDAASKAFNAAAEKWAAIAYWPSNELNDDDQIAKCESYLRKWEKKVGAWQKKAKGLAQFQRVGK